MEEHSSGKTPSGASQINLDDFAEAVVKGVMRALQSDDVAGYLGTTTSGEFKLPIRIIYGIWIDPTGPYGGGLPGGTLTRQVS